jgi:hypothetical protein
MRIALTVSSNNREANENNIDAPNYHISVREIAESTGNQEMTAAERAGLPSPVNPVGAGDNATKNPTPEGGITFTFNTTDKNRGEAISPKTELFLVTRDELKDGNSGGNVELGD